jgi:hypothetical protein
MMHYFLFFAVAVALVSPAIAENGIAHTSVEFHFTVDLPYSDAAPLFGAWAEQKWAPEFKPEFLYPLPPADQEGAVFRVQKGEHSSVWVNTVFNLPAGHVQYVYMLEAILVTRIDIHLRKDGEHKTDVSVTYERTALDPSGNEKVESMAKTDAHSADEWRDAINAYGASMKPGR